MTSGAASWRANHCAIQSYEQLLFFLCVLNQALLILRTLYHASLLINALSMSSHVPSTSCHLYDSQRPRPIRRKRTRVHSMPKHLQSIPSGPILLPSILYSNIRSIKNKLDEVTAIIIKHNSDVAIFTESWLDSAIDQSSINISSYNTIRCDRSGRKGGGVLVYLKSSITFQVLFSGSICDTDMIALHLPRCKLLLIALYHPYWGNNAAHDSVLDKLTMLASDFLLNSSHSRICIVGDLNDLSKLTESFCSMFSLAELIHFNTRLDKKPDSILSNCNSFYRKAVKLSPIASSDHCAILLTPKVKCKVINSPEIFLHDYSPANRSIFNCLVNQVDWNELFDSSDLDFSLSCFLQTLSSLHDYCFPSRKLKTRSSEKPWITVPIKMLICSRDIVYKRQGCSQKFKHLRNKIKSMIKSSKSKYLKDVSKMGKSDWMRIKNIAFPSPPSNNCSFSPEVLNDYFASVYISDDCSKDLNLDCLKSSHIQLSCQEIENGLSKLKKNGGVPNIPCRIFREYAGLFAPFITNLFNHCLNAGHVPKQFKYTNIIPVAKTSNPINASDFRPISLVSPLLKLMEHFVLKLWLIPHLSASQFHDQFAFVPIRGKGATSALTLYNGTVLEKLDAGLEVDALFIDMSKAFDRATTSHILAVLAESNVPIECLNWVFSFMTDRRHRVVVNGNYSVFTEAKSGVPQGSKCGPILFAYLISTLRPLDAGSLAIKYADDLTILNWHNSLQHEVDNVISWCSTNQMLINSTKTKMMCYHKETRNILIDGQPVDIVDNFNLLGLTIQNNCKWEQQVDLSIAKASRRIFPLLQLRRAGIDHRTLWNVYNTHIRSVITYCYPAFCNLPKGLFKKLAKFEKRVEMTLGSKPPTSLSSHCDQLCTRLFQCIVCIEHHPLRSLFELVPHCHNLRRRKNRKNRDESSNVSSRIHIVAPHCKSSRRSNTIIKYALTS